MEFGAGHIDYDNPHPDVVHAYSKATEVFQEAGDAILFVDCTVHGSAPRTATFGKRRFVVYRYGPGMLTRYNCATRPVSSFSEKPFSSITRRSLTDHTSQCLPSLLCLALL